MTVLTNAQITEIALSNGFKLKEQPDGTMALNPYVFDFVRDCIKKNYEFAMVELLRVASHNTPE